FARILDAAYRMPGGMVILSMTDDLQVNSKGMDLDARFFIALRGNDECHFVEPQTNHHAMIILSPGLSDRGCFDHADDLRAYTADFADEFAILMLTLDSAVSKMRCMSLHQYIRLKRLWAARSRLLKGGCVTAATCARAQGFHHLGEFAAAYRATYHKASFNTP